MGQAIERIFLPIMKRQFPEIVDMHMPFEGVFHNLMIVSIKKSYPGVHARKVMNAIWGLVRRCSASVSLSSIRISIRAMSKLLPGTH